MRSSKLVRSGCLVVAGWLMFTLGGCTAAPVTGTVQGKVTYEGTPVSDARIQLQSAETGAAAAAVVGPGGIYKIDTPLVAGTYSVIILPVDDAPPAGSTPTPPEPKVRSDIPESYRMASTSGLTCTITAGQQTFDVNMTANK